MIDDLSKKRVEKLTDRGVQYLEAGSYGEALQVAAELEDAKGLLAFYLAGETYARMNDLKSAVHGMRRGVLIRPTFWMNWFFLAIYLGRLEKYDEAFAAYHQALLCPQVDADMIRLNMAILALGRQDFQNTLVYLDSIEKVENRWGVESSRIVALEGIGRIAEAAELGEQYLRERPEGDEEYHKRVGFVAAALARIRLGQGSSADEVRSFLLHCLDEYGCSVPVLREIRMLKELRYSKESKYYRFLIHTALPVGHPWYRESPGYFVGYDVVADSESRALELINEFESAAGAESVEVLEFKIIEDKSEEAMGVYWVTERVFS